MSTMQRLYLLYLKQKQERPAVDNKEDSQPEGAGNATIYVSGFKESSTKDAITLFFENKRRSGGGDLCEGKEGYKRMSPTVARLTFVASKGNLILNCVIIPESSISAILPS